MAKSIEELSFLLSYIEPNPNRKLGITSEDIPNLEKLSQAEDLVIATRAVGELCKINDDKAFKAILKAIDKDIPVLKIAVAIGSKHLSRPNFDKVIPVLLEDVDLGVRKVTLKYLPKDISATIKNQIKKMILRDNSETIRNLAQKIIEK